MKILEFKKMFWFIMSLIFICLAALSLYINKLSYDRYLERREEYIEVDCIVIEVNDIDHTAKIAYVNPEDGIEYYVVFETIEYEVDDIFTGVIRPEEPTKLRFDNGYSFWNPYSYLAVFLVSLAIIIDLIIIKRLLVRAIAFNGDEVCCKVEEVKTFFHLHLLVVSYNGKQYKSEIFRTFDNISLLNDARVVNMYKNGLIYHIDLASFRKTFNQ